AGSGPVDPGRGDGRWYFDTLDAIRTALPQVETTLCSSVRRRAMPLPKRVRQRKAGWSGTPLSVELLEDRTLPSLVAAYGFNEEAGTAVLDSSGNGNAGTISGAARTTAGKYGGALSFNGTDSWVTVADADSLDLTGGMTLEAWVYPTNIDGWECVVLKED